VKISQKSLFTCVLGLHVSKKRIYTAMNDMLTNGASITTNQLELAETAASSKSTYSAKGALTLQFKDMTNTVYLFLKKRSKIYKLTCCIDYELKVNILLTVILEILNQEIHQQYVYNLNSL
jgi:hypothetical protein